jgi:tripartite-type tricarboxylate transporter receptor subunit TctC
MAEAGVPGYEAVSADGMVVPARTPAAIINRLNPEIVRALPEPNTKQTLFNSGVVSAGRVWSLHESVGSNVIKDSKIRVN